MSWAAEELGSDRLVLEPLTVEHAAGMVAVLADHALYEYTGGEPPTLERLQHRYAAQVAGGAADGSEWWLNWIVTRRDSGAPVGFVQATVRQCAAAGAAVPEGAVADLAWVIGSTNQGQGFASEATDTMLQWLRSQGITRFSALIHPDHAASNAVARHQGFAPTDQVHEGEIRWESRGVTRAPWLRR